ncbi:hypothetical protein AAC387_Pa10g2037 [Persea americana]
MERPSTVSFNQNGEASGMSLFFNRNGDVGGLRDVLMFQLSLSIEMGILEASGMSLFFNFLFQSKWGGLQLSLSIKMGRPRGCPYFSIEMGMLEASGMSLFFNCFFQSKWGFWRPRGCPYYSTVSFNRNGDFGGLGDVLIIQVEKMGMLEASGMLAES